MARGGYRPGAGRPKLTEAEKAERAAARAGGSGASKPAAKKAPKKRTNPHLDLPLDVAGEAAMANMSPLDYMLYVMRSGQVESARRDRMAIAAAPFMHARKEAVGPGKREAADLAAKGAGSKFKTGSAPLKLVGKG